MKIYVDAQQTGGVSATSPNGDFVMRFSTHADGSQDIFGGSLGYLHLAEGAEPARFTFTTPLHGIR